MLRRRILASAMASVMAIGSVAVVASAEDAAVATTNVKSKADLEAYVKSFDKFVADTIYDYGSISGEDFLDAYEYAENVLADLEADVYDYTVAYKMMETTYNKLVIYSAAELKALVDSCKATYEKGNFYNEDLGDPIYKEDKFENFENAYESAESVLTSSDSRVITDAYEVLASAKDNLEKYGVVTKSEFRAALKAYETALQAEFKYDSWRRGELTTNWLESIANWRYTDGRVAAYGLVYDFVAGCEEEIYQQYDIMDGIKQVNVTSQEDIVKAYNKCKDVTSLLTSFKADDTDKATKATVKKLLNDYHGLLVHDYAKSEAEALAKAVNAAVAPALKDGASIKVTLVGAKIGSDYGTREESLAVALANEVWYEDFVEYTASPRKDQKVNRKKLAEAGIYVKSDVTYYIPVNKEGYYRSDCNIITDAKSKVSGVDYKTVTKKSTFDLTSVIDVRTKVVAKTYNEIFDELAAEFTTTNAKAAAAETTTPGDTLVIQQGETAKAADAVSGAVDETKNALTAAAEAVKAGADEATAKSIDAVLAFLDGIYANVDAVIAAVEKGDMPATKGKGAAVSDDADVITAQIKAINAVKDSMVLEAAGWGGTKVNIFAGSAAFKDTIRNVDPSYAAGAEAIAYAKDAAGNDIYEADIKKGLEITTKLDALVEELNNTLEAIADVKKYDAIADEAADREDCNEVENYLYNNVIDSPFWVRSKDSDGNYIMDSEGNYVLEGEEFYVGSSNNNRPTNVNLEDAMALAEFYLKATKAEDYKKTTNPLIANDERNDIYPIANTGEIIYDNVNGSSKEWTEVYRYLMYALSDKYGNVQGVHTKADVEDLIEKSYELAELTGDAALFRLHHDALVNARASALEWVKLANKDRTKYKDNVTPELYEGDKLVADQVYGKLNEAYKALNDDYNAFKYSFGEIADYISEVAELIDDGDLTATDELVAALNEAAYRLSTVESIDGAIAGAATLDDDAFTSDRFFLAYNRVYTKGDEEYTINGQKVNKSSKNAASKSHENLKNAYEALQAEVKKQTEVTVLVGDVNGDGVADQKDAAEILKAVVNGTVIEVAVGDFNADGAVDQRDAAAILKHVVGLA